MPDIRVQDEQGNIHVFPDGSTPEMIAQAMNVKAPTAPSFMEKLGKEAEKTNYGAGDFANPDHPAHAMVTQALSDLKEGNYSKGAHGLIGAASEFLKPTRPLTIGMAPISSAIGYGASYAGSKLAQAGAEKLGATPEQQQLAGDVGGIAGGVGGSKLATAPSWAAKTAPRLYQSALKPSTTLPTSKVASMVETGLENKIPVSASGVEKLGSLIDDLNDKIKTQIQSGAQSGATVNKFAVTSRLSDVSKKFATQVNPESDLAAVGESGNEFLRNQPNQIPIEQAQAMKQGTYQQLKGRAYGELKSATVESQKALARGLKEEIATQFPEIGQLNAKESQLIGLDDALERAVRRIDNHQMLGIGTPIAAAGAGAITHSTGIGAAAGILKAVIDDPILKSRLAIALNKAGKGANPVSQANSRIAAYSAALAGASSAQPRDRQANGQGAEQ